MRYVYPGRNSGPLAGLTPSTPTDSPTGPDSGYSSESADAVAVDISLQRTARQHAVLERAHVHLSVLNNMARERVTNTTPSLFLSIDLEVYNGQHDILEVGLAWIFGHQVWQCTDRPLPVECHHLVIKENAHLHNHGTYDQREKFVYGDSRLISESAILETLARLLPPVVFTECPVYLIGHTIQNDVKWLNHADVDLFKLIPHLTVCDIGRAWQAMRDEPQSTGLGRMLDHAGCQHPHTHNAGNDARYSIDICLKMMEELAAAADLSVCETPLL